MNMIKYEGIKKGSTLSLLIFSNEAGYRVEIPIELPIADRIIKYLAKISTTNTEAFQPNNDVAE